MADLAISKTASAGAVAPGQALTYTLAYTNYGPSTASYFTIGPTGTIVISDIVPAILTGVAYAASDPALTPWPGITYTWSLWHLHPGEGGVITITGVEVTNDLEHAKVFVTALGSGDHQAVLTGLRRASGFLRSQLAHRMKLRIVPQLSFEYDESVERGMHLSQLIDQAIAEDAKHPKDE